MTYRPASSPERIAELRRWQERTYQEMTEAGEQRLSYLDLERKRSQPS